MLITRRSLHTIIGALSLLLTLSAHALDPELAQVEQQIRQIEKRVSDDPSDYRARTTLIQLAMHRARLSGEIDAVITQAPTLDLILKENPHYHLAKLTRASIAIMRHEFDRALSIADEALKVDPHDPTFLSIKVDAERELGRYSECAATLKQLSELVENDPGLLLRRAQLLRVSGNNSDANAAYQSAIVASNATKDRSPLQHAHYHLLYGAYLFSTGDLLGAAREYLVAQKAAPTWWMTLDKLAELRGAQRRFAEAQTLFEQAYQATKRPEIAHSLGDLLLFQGKITEGNRWLALADKGYSEAAERGETHYLHHQAHLYADSLKLAERSLTVALRDRELRQTADTLDQLAWAHYRTGALDQAYVEIQGALSARSNDPHILEHAAMIYGALGKLHESKELLLKAASINPAYMQFHSHR